MPIHFYQVNLKFGILFQIVYHLLHSVFIQNLTILYNDLEQKVAILENVVALQPNVVCLEYFLSYLSKAMALFDISSIIHSGH